VDPDPAYTQVIQERAQKIVDKLGIDNSTKALHVRDLIADQYRSLSMLHDTRNRLMKTHKDKAAVEAMKALTQSLQDQLHTRYLLKLNAVLNSEQVDQIKDGMTIYQVQRNYNAFLELLPNLTDEEKATIMSYMVEARELAMDAGSSNEKVHLFIKYRGRTNNYLSSRGYDLKKASQERNERNENKKQ
jgi:hypothetical protein